MHADVKKNVVGGFKGIKLLDTNGQTILSYRAAHTDIPKILVILKLKTLYRFVGKLHQYVVLVM